MIIFIFFSCLSEQVSFAFQIEPLNVQQQVSGLVFDSLPLNLEETTSSAGKVFSGTCTEAKEVKKDLVSNLHIIGYTFKINEKIKGFKNKQGSNEISFKQWVPTTRDAGYEVGKKYVLFLCPESTLGLTSPVGYLHGKFNIVKDKDNTEVVTNGLSNKGLSRNLRTKKKIFIYEDKALDEYIDSSSEHGEPIRYEDFIRSVKHFVKRGHEN